MPDKNKILVSARKLADEMRLSDIYKKYRDSLENIRRQPSLHLRLCALKEAQAEAEARREPDKPAAFEDELAISRKYSELANEPDAAEFLINEKEFLNVYSAVLDIIDSAFEMDVF